YADSQLGEVLIWHFFNQLVIRRFVWKEQPDEALLKKAREEDIPHCLDYLETELPATGFFCQSFGMADIALASFFRNAYFARWTIDGQRWPKVANWLSEVLAHESFAKLSRFEEISLRTPIEKHRSALAEAGAPISEASFFSPSPRRGILVI
ncbi:MAG: glutathione S-transferase family protein, partial [Betaproteobacteria bacterium]|nr:glutathione S-transferase family protein [Betaproteobacteria bacterium]